LGRVEDFDAIVIGLGFRDFITLSLRELGLRVRCVEDGDGVGGTWYWTAIRDAALIRKAKPTVSFSKELLQEWTGRKLFVQPENERYLNYVSRQV